LYKSAEEELKAELEDEVGDMDWAVVTRLPASLSRGDVRTLVAAPTNEKHALLMRVMYSTGMRPGEVCDFKWADVSTEDRSIFVRAGKCDKDRYVCVDDDTLDVLAGFRGRQPLHAAVFGVTAQHIWKVIRKYADATGLTERYAAMDRRVSPHILRHAYATHCYENGMDLFALQLLMGHVFLETTRIYVHMALRRVRRQYDRAHEFSRKRARSGP
jgi:site-specific recombinase XerD